MNATESAVGPPPGKGWLRSVLWVVRLLAFFVVLLAGDIVAQFGRMWVAQRASAAGAEWMLIGAALVLAAALLGLYVVIVRGIFSVSLAGPRLLTGGAFGPEASLVAIAVGLTAAIVLTILTVRAGRWISLQPAPTSAL